LSLKHIYHIALIKKLDAGFEGVTLEAVCSRVLAQAVGVGIKVVP
jgi:ribosomal protein L11